MLTAGIILFRASMEENHDFMQIDFIL